MMPYVNIYRNGRQIETKKFNRQFVISGYKVLFWRADEDEGWTTDMENSETLETLKDAHRQVMLTNTSAGYELSSVLPSWRLWINQEECERGFYGDIMIMWDKVKLVYRDYEFLFLFEPNEAQVEGIVKNSLLPSPILNEKQIDWDYWDCL